MSLGEIVQSLVKQASWRDGLVLLLFFAISYQIIWAIYVIFLHPLARFPGPKLWLVTSIPYAKGLRRGTMIHRMKQLHEQYGSVVRYGVNELSYIDGQAWKDIYGFHGGPDKNFDRDRRFYQPALNGAPSLLSADNVAHAHIRKLLTPAFTEAAVREQEYILQGYSDLLIEKLTPYAKTGRPVNIGDYFQFTTFDVAGDLMYGESFGCLEKEEFHTWLKVMRAFFKRLVVGAAFISLMPSFVRPLVPYLIPKRLHEQTKTRFAFTVEKVGQRIAMGEQPNRADFMTHMLRTNEKTGFHAARPEIDSTFDVLVSAASGTTSTGLIGAMQYLLRNPRSMARLQSEIRAAFPSAGAITLAGVNAMPFLTAVLNEAMRLCPPSPALRPRVVPKGGAMVCGHWLPEGVSVGIPHWSTYRNANNFARPDDFVPERWLEPEQGGVALVPHNVQAFQPFSFGPRGCLGRPLGWAEMRLILAKVLWHFDVENKSPGNKWEDQKTFVGWDIKPMVVGLHEAKA